MPVSKVYGDKDADGFYFGEKQNGKNGHIPCNMISEVQVTTNVFPEIVKFEI